MIFIGDVFRIGEKALSLSSKSMDVAIITGTLIAPITDTN